MSQTEGLVAPEPASAPPLPPARRKVFDVTRPGHAPASATARPVIVGVGPKQADPMVAEPPAKPSFADGPMTSPPRPFASFKESASAGSSAEPAASPAADNAWKIDNDLETGGPLFNPNRSASESSAGASKSDDMLATLGDAATNAVLQDTLPPSLADRGTPVVSRGAGASWWAVVIIIVILLLLAVAVLDVLLDAQLLKTSLHIPHTHFFKR